MSEKRFIYGSNEYWVKDNENNVELLPIDVLILLNELHEENQELKRLIKKMGELGGFNKHLIKTICGDLE